MAEGPHSSIPSSSGKARAALQRDPLPERMIIAGCLLLTIPCVLATLAAIFYGLPMVVGGLR